jgi:hypothetical protein
VIPPDALAAGLTQNDWNQLIDFNNGSGGGLGDIGGYTPQQYANMMGTTDGISGLGGLNGLAGAGQTGDGSISGSSPGGGLKPGTSAGGSLLNSLGGLGGILPLLLAAGSGLMGRQATQQATQQTVQGINNASDQANKLITGAQANYNPYMQAGGTALSKLANAAPSNIAGMFKPLGTGRYVK